MKRQTILLYLFLFTLAAGAQKKDLMVKSGEKGLYIEHKVVKGESFFRIGKLYNVSPKYLSDFNDWDLSKSIWIDMSLRIPLTDTNFTQQGRSGAPVYYKAADRDNLAGTSSKFNNVSVSQLKHWNGLSGDDIKSGSKLIIGFLKGSQMPSITINTPVKTDAGIVKEEKKTESKPVVKTEERPVVKTENKPVAKTEERPVVKTEEKPVVKLEERPVVKTEDKPVVKTEERPVVKLEERPVVSPQGYFKSHFDQQVKSYPPSRNETVTSGIFKTTSGWQDAKYYLLIDKVPPGTIIKVVNPANNKSVFAKVLGEMTGIRQNEGLNIRISNAAATALDVSEQDKFIVSVNY